MKLTETDKKNGWNQADLDRYHKDQDKASQEKLFKHLFERVVKPREANHRYSPHRWRD